MNPSITYLQEDLLLTISNLPLEIKKGKKKDKYSINFNVFMRSHHTAITKMRTLYQQLVEDKLSKENRNNTGTFKVLFVYYRPNMIARDLSNMCSIVDKFTMDVLTKKGIIPNDSVNYVTSVHYLFGGTKKDQHFIDFYLFKNKENDNYGV